MGWIINSIMSGNTFFGYEYQSTGGAFGATQCSILQQKTTSNEINKPGKPYICPKSSEEILKLKDTNGFVNAGPDLGSGQCVALVKAVVPALGATKNYSTGELRWCKAEKITTSNLDKILPGTVVGYGFNSEGKYPSNSSGNHVAIFIKKDGEMMAVIDQWHSVSKGTKQEAKQHNQSVTKRDWYIVTLCN